MTWVELKTEPLNPEDILSTESLRRYRVKGRKDSWIVYSFDPGCYPRSEQLYWRGNGNCCVFFTDRVNKILSLRFFKDVQVLRIGNPSLVILIFKHLIHFLCFIYFRFFYIILSVLAVIFVHSLQKLFQRALPNKELKEELGTSLDSFLS